MKGVRQKAQGTGKRSQNSGVRSQEAKNTKTVIFFWILATRGLTI
jgi:hypothetical protein